MRKDETSREWLARGPGQRATCRVRTTFPVNSTVNEIRDRDVPSLLLGVNPNNSKVVLDVHHPMNWGGMAEQKKTIFWRAAATCRVKSLSARSVSFGKRKTVPVFELERSASPRFAAGRHNNRLAVSQVPK